VRAHNRHDSYQKYSVARTPMGGLIVTADPAAIVHQFRPAWSWLAL